MRVDCTWPRSAEALGMAVNHDLRPGVDMALACDPIDFYEVPDGMEPQTFKEQLIDCFCGSQSKTRDQFIESMSNWLAHATS